MQSKAERIDRAKGCLLGLAVGDAVGTTVEFKSRGSFEPLTDMVGGGPFGLQPGEWTDDTSLALCLGASLLEYGFDLRDQISRYVRWYRNGYMSVNGQCFDIGTTTRASLRRFEADGNPLAGSMDPAACGNGSIMRLAPVPIIYLDGVHNAVHLSGEQSRTTHGTLECVEASQILGRILVQALRGESDKTALCLSAGELEIESARLRGIAAGNYFELDAHSVHGTGYVVDSLEAALWCFHTTDSFEAAILTAANLGDDADTTAAITGQIAGAYYGEQGIPHRWLERLAMKQEISDMAVSLSTKCSKR